MTFYLFVCNKVMFVISKRAFIEVEPDTNCYKAVAEVGKNEENVFVLYVYGYYNNKHVASILLS